MLGLTPANALHLLDDLAACCENSGFRRTIQHRKWLCQLPQPLPWRALFTSNVGRFLTDMSAGNDVPIYPFLVELIRC